MDLSSILKKTEKKNTSIKRNKSNNTPAKKINIADKDRPYDLKEIQKNNPKKKTATNNIEVATQNKVTTNHLQSDYKTNYKESTKNLQSNYKTDNKVYTNNLQSDYKKSTLNDNILGINKIYGIQKNIINYLFFKCQKNGSRITDEITINELMDALSTTKKNVKTSIYRLEKKNFISRQDFKNGRGGWTKYEIPELVYSELFKTQELNRNDFNDEKVTTNISTSSSNNINTTTSLPSEWEKINFEVLREYGFNEKHILQISKIDSISPDELQDSIDYFIFDLQENSKAKEIKKSPVAFFMGILRGHGIYTAPKNYESPQARKLRLKIEQQKAEQEKIEKLETELINTEFNSWRSKLTNDKVEGLLPDKIKTTTVAKDRQIRGFLREYFVKNFWDAIKYKKYADCFAD